MPAQFVVPQFIEVEDRIFGPITVRQFIIMLVTAGIIFLFSRLFDFALFVLTGLPLLAIGGVVAFVKINGQPFHFFLLNLVQTLKKPGLRIWNKQLTDSELRKIISAPAPKPPPVLPKKAPLEATRLAELSLIVNTGGVFKPEEEW